MSFNSKTICDSSQTRTTYVSPLPFVNDAPPALLTGFPALWTDGVNTRLMDVVSLLKSSTHATAVKVSSMPALDLELV